MTSHFCKSSLCWDSPCFHIPLVRHLLCYISISLLFVKGIVCVRELILWSLQEKRTKIVCFQWVLNENPVCLIRRLLSSLTMQPLQQQCAWEQDDGHGAGWTLAGSHAGTMHSQSVSIPMGCGAVSCLAWLLAAVCLPASDAFTEIGCEQPMGLSYLPGTSWSLFQKLTVSCAGTQVILLINLLTKGIDAPSLRNLQGPEHSLYS